MSEIKTASALSDQVKNFFKQYKDIEGNFKYVEQIDKLKENSSILIIAKDLLQSDIDDSLELYNELNLTPLEFLKAAQRAAKEILQEKNPQLAAKIKDEILIHVDEVERTPSIIEVLGHEYLNQIVTIKGIIISSSEKQLLPKQLVYKCSNNHQWKTGYVKTSKIQNPYRCGYDPKCTSKLFEVLVNEASYIKQRILNIKSNENFSFTDDELELDVIGDLTEVAQTGDKVKVTGIVEPLMHKNVIKSNLKTLFIQKTEDIDVKLSPEDEEVFKEFPEQSDFYTRMINSIAPSVLGLKSIKESLLLQRIGSPHILKDDGTKVRGFFNIGLWGDPGTAKTKLGEWEETNLTKTVFIMSKGATSTGLLLGLEEGTDGRKRLRAGAMVLCRDDGLVVIDEFPRLSSEVIDGLYTTMENGMVSISKTGHQKSLDANTPVLATGNAFNGEWNESLNIQDNLGINSTFLQRFDFMWILLDNFDEKKDSALVDITLNDVQYSDEEKPHSSTTLQKYIKFVRRFNPELSQDVNEHLKNAYLELRKDPKAKENGISLRHLNTMIRTTLAIARLFQRPYATVEDSDKAISLMREMFMQRNISISEADTYVQRNLNKAINILKNEGLDGLTIPDLHQKILEYGSTQDQEQARTELGMNTSLSDNKKLRAVVERLKKSPLVIIRNRKPLILAYDHNKENMDVYFK